MADLGDCVDGPALFEALEQGIERLLRVYQGVEAQEQYPQLLQIRFTKFQHRRPLFTNSGPCGSA